MNRHEEIKNAYKNLGGDATFYDGMITCSTLSGKAVCKLPFENEGFALVMSLNGFHAFPDKEAAYSEIFRVLKPGGVFCGCFYVKGENKRTDFLVDKIYTPKGYFTPPYETAESLQKRLNDMIGVAATTFLVLAFCSTVKADCRKILKKDVDHKK